MANVQELTNGDFTKLLENHKGKLVVVDFYAEWCMPCVMMGPVFEEVAEANKKAEFVKVNIEDSQNIAQKYNVSSIPCFIFFKNEKEVDRVVGSVSEEVLNEKIEEHK